MAWTAIFGCKNESSSGHDPTSSETTALTEGDPAPDVTLQVHDGSAVKLADLKGQQVLVYFYPKDDTPGCTLEAKGLRDHYDELGRADVKIFGVSLQDAESHKAFIDKYGLPFPLVVDDGTLARAFGVPVRGEFAARQSFLVGRDGNLSKIWRDVTPASHASEVLAAARASR
jgi:thioredoxin-dependent peroxiredoxin